MSVISLLLAAVSFAQAGLTGRSVGFPAASLFPSQNRFGGDNPSGTAALTQYEIASAGGVKITINRDGWYRVDASELAAVGFDPGESSKLYQLYHNQEEIPMIVFSDGSIEFFGHGTDDPYTDSSVYYLVVGSVPGLRVSWVLTPIPPKKLTGEAFENVVIDKERINYFSRVLNGEAENWFGEFVGPAGATRSLNSQNIHPAYSATLSVKLQGLTNHPHLVNVRLNGSDLGVVNFSNLENRQVDFEVPGSSLFDGDNAVSLQSLGGASDFSMIDSISLRFSRQYVAENNSLHFTLPAGDSVETSGFDSPKIEIYEISNGKAFTELDVGIDPDLGLSGFSIAPENRDRELIAVSRNGKLSPYRIELDAPSSWHDTANQADLLILSSASLEPYAQTLAARRQNQGFNAKVVLVEDIADEFGSGILTPAAIRTFLELAATQWSVRPGYVLLFGDSSYDMRNYLGGGRNVIPTKLIETFDMETSSDGWLVDFDNNGVEDISIGRLPVATNAEAQRILDKIDRYETQNFSGQQNALLVADYYFEILNGALEDLLPGSVNATRVERWQLTNSEMTQQIIAGANNNPTVVSYLGHGYTGAWATGGLFTVADAANLTNQKLSFYMLMTCLNGYSHNTVDSLSEALIKADNGAIAVWASSGSTYASGQIEMGQDVISNVMPASNALRPVGDVVREAKAQSSSWDARRTWQLLGDPTMTIN